MHHQGKKVGVVFSCGKDAGIQILCGATGTRALGKLYKGVMGSGKELVLAAVFTVSFNASRSWRMSC